MFSDFLVLVGAPFGMGAGPMPPGVGGPGLGPVGMLGPGMPTQTSNMPLNIQNMFPPSFNTAQLLQQSKGSFQKPSHVLFSSFSDYLLIFSSFILLGVLFLPCILFLNNFQILKGISFFII